MPLGGLLTRMRLRGTPNREHSFWIFVAINAYCVRYSRFSGYYPSHIGRLRCAVWGDDLKILRTVAKRGSGGLARRLAPRSGQRILAGYGVQCRYDVHGATLCISGRSVRRAPRTANVRGLVHVHQRPAAIFCELADHVGAVGACGSYGGDILPTHIKCRSAHPAHEVCTAGDCDVRHGRCHYIEHLNFALSLVQGAPVMALDLLEQCGTHASHDGVHLLWHPLAAVAKTQRGTAQTDLARIFLCESRVGTAVYSARARAAAELDELRDDHCAGRYRFLSVAGGVRSPCDTATQADQFKVPGAAKHAIARVDRSRLRILIAGDALFAARLSRIRQRLSPTPNRAGNALGRPASAHFRATCNVSAEIYRRPVDPDCRLRFNSDRLPDERATFLSMVRRQFLAFAGGHVGWYGARLQRSGRRPHT